MPLQQSDGSPRECQWCHRFMTLTSLARHTIYPDLDIAKFDCECGYLLALPVPQKEKD